MKYQGNTDCGISLTQIDILISGI